MMRVNFDALASSRFHNQLLAADWKWRDLPERDLNRLALGRRFPHQLRRACNL